MLIYSKLKPSASDGWYKFIMLLMPVQLNLILPTWKSWANEIPSRVIFKKSFRGKTFPGNSLENEEIAGLKDVCYKHSYCAAVLVGFENLQARLRKQ